MGKINREIERNESEELNKLPLSSPQKTYIRQIWSKTKKPKDYEMSFIKKTILNLVFSYGLIGLIVIQLTNPTYNLTKFIGWWGWILTILLMIMIPLGVVVNILEESLLSLATLKSHFQKKNLWKKFLRILRSVNIVIITLGLVYLDKSVLASFYLVSTLLIVWILSIRKEKINEILEKINEDHYGQNTIPI